MEDSRRLELSPSVPVPKAEAKKYRKGSNVMVNEEGLLNLLVEFVVYVCYQQSMYYSYYLLNNFESGRLNIIFHGSPCP